MNSEIESNSINHWHTNLLKRNAEQQALVTELRYHCDVYKLGLRSIQKIVKSQISTEFISGLNNNAFIVRPRRKNCHNNLSLVSQRRVLEKINRIILKAKLFIHGYSLLAKPLEAIEQNDAITEDKGDKGDKTESSAIQKVKTVCAETTNYLTIKTEHVASSPENSQNQPSNTKSSKSAGTYGSENDIKRITAGHDPEYAMEHKKHIDKGQRKNVTRWNQTDGEVTNDNKESYGQKIIHGRLDSESHEVSITSKNSGKVGVQSGNWNKFSPEKKTSFPQPSCTTTPLLRNKQNGSHSQIKTGIGFFKNSWNPKSHLQPLVELSTTRRESKESRPELSERSDHRFYPQIISQSTIANIERTRPSNSLRSIPMQYKDSQRFMHSKRNFCPNNICNMRSATCTNKERIDRTRGEISKTLEPTTSRKQPKGEALSNAVSASAGRGGSIIGHGSQRKRCPTSSPTCTGYYEGKVRRVNVYPENYYKGEGNYHHHHHYSRKSEDGLEDKPTGKIQTHVQMNSTIFHNNSSLMKTMNDDDSSELHSVKDIPPTCRDNMTNGRKAEKSPSISMINFTQPTISPTIQPPSEATYWPDPRLKRRQSTNS